MKTPALYALSADPLTLGHTGVITQSLQTNDLLIAIAGNDTKSPLFDQ